MTSVLISHNPFRTETEILIDEQPITDTSVLFKYLRTPMQDWVGDFLPSLIADCNDDELEITFRGLPYHYEDLKAELEKFLRENEDYSIELSFDACEDQTTRLNTLNDILNEIKTQDTVEELKDPDFTSSLDPTNNRLAALVLGGPSSQQEVLVTELFGPEAYNPQTDIQNILLDVNHQFAPSTSDSSPGLESLEALICSDDKPIVICLLDNQLKRSKAGFLDIIAAQHRIRGKQNKQRFLFVAETPALAKRTLHSEFAIKNAFVYAFDETSLIHKRIKEYYNEVSLIYYISEQCDRILLRLNTLEQNLSTRAEEARTFENIDRLEARTFKALYNCELVTSLPNISDFIDSFIIQLCSEFNVLKPSHPTLKGPLFSKSINNVLQSVMESQDIVETAPMKKIIISYIQGLPQKFEKALATIESNVRSYAHINVPRELYTTLDELGCPTAVTLLQQLKKHLNDTAHVSLNKNKYIEDIQKITFEEMAFNLFSNSLNYVLVEDYKAYYTISSHSDSYILRKFQFYPGLIVRCCKCLSAETYSSKELVIKSQEKFAQDIKAVIPIFEAFFQGLISLYESQYKNIFDQALENISKAIQEQAQYLRDTAGISEDDLARLQCIQSMKARITQLTCLGAEGN